MTIKRAAAMLTLIGVAAVIDTDDRPPTLDLREAAAEIARTTDDELRRPSCSREGRTEAVCLVRYRKGREVACRLVRVVRMRYAVHAIERSDCARGSGKTEARR